jgi:hypothetical protein
VVDRPTNIGPVVSDGVPTSSSSSSSPSSSSSKELPPAKGGASGGASGGGDAPRDVAQQEQQQQQQLARGANRTAIFESTSNAGQRGQLKTGTITINDRSYTFRSGGYGNGNLPPGEYRVTPHMWNRTDSSYSVDGVGYTFALNDVYDPRVRATRTLLRIHPDGGVPGTLGCIGIVGDGGVQRRFRDDMRAEFARSGSGFTLTVR